MNIFLPVLFGRLFQIRGQEKLFTMILPVIEKQLNLLDYALFSLWRRKLKNSTVMLVFSAVIFLVASFQMVTAALVQTASDVLSYSPEITVQRMSAGRQESIPMAYSERLSGIYGIRRIVPRIWGYHFDEANGANYTIMGLDVTKMVFGSKLELGLSAGEYPDSSAKESAVLGQAVLEIMDLKDRRFFSLFRPDLTLKSFKVAGVFDVSTDMLTGDLIVMNIYDAADLFGIPPGMVTDFCVYVTNPAEIDTIAKKIADILPDTRVLTRPQIQKTYQVVFGWRSGFASVCLLAVLASFAILVWDKASGLSPDERREIGILKVLGWQTADILAVRFWEGEIVSMLAFAIGCTAAYIHVAFFEANFFRPVLMGWSVLRPTLKLLPVVALRDFLLIFCLVVGPYLAATVVPAWRSASVPPDSAIR